MPALDTRAVASLLREYAQRSAFARWQSVPRKSLLQGRQHDGHPAELGIEQARRALSATSATR